MPKNSLSVAHNHFVQALGLSMPQLEQLLSTAMSSQLDAADIFFQNSKAMSWVLEDGQVKDGSFHQDQGAGIRAMRDEQTGFAYTEDLHMDALLQSARAARSIARGNNTGIQHITTGRDIATIYPAFDPWQDITTPQIVTLLQQLDTHARQMDPRIQQVIVSFSMSYDLIMVIASDGTHAADARPLCRLNVSVIAAANDHRERGSSGGGGRQMPAQLFLDKGSASAAALHYAEEAVRQALVNLGSQPAPAGLMTVVLGPGWPGVLLHEAIGHGLEGDFNRRGTSAFSGRIGEMVASARCTIVDDATLPGRRGSINIDDEGVAAQSTTLIENGRLVAYMQDKRNARLMGSQSSGNGRRESYAHVPLPRMTNTYMLPGESTHEEIIASVKRGIYAPNFGGGQVDITSGQFVFSASEAYLIEDGRITAPIRGATLIGNGPEILKQVSMVGNNLALDQGVGICGKEGQSIPVGVGQPTLKLDQLLVGGTEN